MRRSLLALVPSALALLVPAAGFCDVQSAVSTKPLKIVQRMLIFRPEAGSVGCYDVALLIKNRSRRRVALNAGNGQLSLLDDKKLVESDTPNGFNILPGGYGLIDSGFCPGRILKAPRLSVRLDLDSWRRGPRRSPVSFVGVTKTLVEDFPGRQSWTLAGIVRNRFTRKKYNLQIRSGGFVAGRLVCTGFTYVDVVYPRLEATFDIEFDHDTCPPEVDRFEIYPNLGDEKIFQP